MLSVAKSLCLFNVGAAGAKSSQTACGLQGFRNLEKLYRALYMVFRFGGYSFWNCDPEGL